MHPYNSQGEFAGGVIISFSSTLQYYLSWCTSFTNFPSTLPSAVDKVWRISLTKTSGITLLIHCNDVEVLNLLLSDEICNGYRDWRDFWSRDVEKIAFSEHDTASDYYRLYQRDEGIKNAGCIWSTTFHSHTDYRFQIDIDIDHISN